MDPLADQQSLFESFQLSPGFDIKVHKNAIILLFVRPDSNIARFTFNDALKENLQNLTGKKKHGAKTVTEREEFATATLKDGTQVELKSPLRAKLLEINLEQEKGVRYDETVAIYQPKWEQKERLVKYLRGETKDDEKEQLFAKQFILAQ